MDEHVCFMQTDLPSSRKKRDEMKVLVGHTDWMDIRSEWGGENKTLEPCLG